VALPSPPQQGRAAIFALGVSPSNNQVVVVGTGGGALARSADGGSTWKVVHSGSAGLLSIEGAHALDGDPANVEVVAVDDGSTDHSAEVIAGYGDRVMALFQENGGQTSAINAGFGASSGHVVCFLDADDTLLPSALSTAVYLVRGPGCGESTLAPLGG